MKFKVLFLLFLLSIISINLSAQFAPPAGQEGTSAIHKDSSIFIAWASGCTVERGLQDISNPSLGFTTVGEPQSATGKAGENGMLSLGDGGAAILTFDEPIVNHEGWDFAVFENGFTDTFLELAFVEVSSDGNNFFRFPATSLTQDSLQIGPFGAVDATEVDNLAGKYRAHYGTPFDLDQLQGQSGLDINAITHIKIIDVVGSILDEYASLDQYGNKINDPWSTPFESSGFDLDAVGVIQQLPIIINDISINNRARLFPNPANNIVNIKYSNFDDIENIVVINSFGQEMSVDYNLKSKQELSLDTSHLANGLYIINLNTSKRAISGKLLVKHD